MMLYLIAGASDFSEKRIPLFSPMPLGHGAVLVQRFCKPKIGRPILSAGTIKSWKR